MIVILISGEVVSVTITLLSSEKLVFLSVRMRLDSISVLGLTTSSKCSTMYSGSVPPSILKSKETSVGEVVSGMRPAACLGEDTEIASISLPRVSVKAPASNAMNVVAAERPRILLALISLTLLLSKMIVNALASSVVTLPVFRTTKLVESGPLRSLIAS